jgi:protein-tyrosine phosphatase
MARQLRLQPDSSGVMSVSDPRKEIRSVLFVCLGNVIRSPICEALFRKLTRGEIRVDSATSTEDDINQAPYENAQITARRHGFDISRHKSRLITGKDFSAFDLIVTLDKWVYSDVTRLKPRDSGCQVIEFIPGVNVLNPWHEPLNEFDKMYEQIEAGMNELIRKYFPKYSVQ